MLKFLQINNFFKFILFSISATKYTIKCKNTINGHAACDCSKSSVVKHSACARVATSKSYPLETLEIVKM